ncbi:MAG: YjcQ family protein [Solobacterium sp.]|jgi:hypothetical protein|nr:YjcQ family protein [Solobacterium sp.]MCH4281526.1 YjcQ family protein [Solobacterium sp.]
MGNDDYDVVLFKILTYLYGCMKRKCIFDICEFNAVILKQSVKEEYLSDILFMATDEGLIEGLVFTKVWGNNKIISNDLSEMRITSAGIRYLNDNSKMKEIKEYLKAIPGLVADLIRVVF